MIQTNTLPTILDSHGSYAIELDEIQASKIMVSFIIENGLSVRTHNINYRVFNNKTLVRLDSFLKSIFEFKKDDFKYEEDEIIPLPKLKVIIGDFIKEFTIVNGALQLGNGIVMNDFVNRRLGIAKETPLFLGYPKTTSILQDESIKRINNSRGCPFSEEDVNSEVSIQLTRPDGTIENVTNLLELEIPNEQSANGLYEIKFINANNDEEVRTFTVVNAGVDTSPIPVIDILFMRETEDVGNEYAFRYQSFYDQITMKVSLPFEPNQNTRYRFKIAYQSEVVFETSYSNVNSAITINPYLSESTESIFAPQAIGIYTVDLWVLHEGVESHKQETFNITSIQQQTQGQLNATVLIVKDNQSVFTPNEIMGDNDVVIRPLGGYRYKCNLFAITVDNMPIIWELENPNGEVSQITSTDGIVYLFSVTTGPNYFSITQSGTHQLRAIFNYQGQEHTLTRNLNITYNAL